MTDTPPLPFEEVARILHRLSELLEEPDVVLVGGQAVAFWTRFLFDEVPGLPDLALATSKDIDFEGTSDAAKRAGALLEARVVRVPDLDDHTPSTGLVVFADSQGIERQLDFIDVPLGLDAQDVRDTAVRVSWPAPEGSDETVELWVMHPERAMESRIYNAIRLGKTSPLAMDQLRASIVCAREYSRYLLGRDDVSQSKRTRAVLNVNKRIISKCLRDPDFREAHRTLGIDPFEAVLIDDRLPEAFHTEFLPRVRDKLTAQRSTAT